MADTKPKRAPGGSPALSFLLAGAKWLRRLLIGAVVLVAAALFFQPWVLLDPIDRFTHLDRSPRSMIPAVFAEGESRESAMARLRASGYWHWAIEPVAHLPDRCGDSACERRKEGYTDFFRKDSVAWNIACSLHHVVWLKFDGSDRMQAASNEVYDTCL